MKIIDKSFLKFLLVGIVNTGVSFVFMFLLEDLGYWVSTSIAYIAGAGVSFFLNKKYTFNSEEKLLKSAIKFAISVALCYLIAFSLAKPFMVWALSYTALSTIWVERVTKVFAAGLYTLINYFAQKFVAFNKKI